MLRPLAVVPRLLVLGACLAPAALAQGAAPAAPSPLVPLAGGSDGLPGLRLQLDPARAAALQSRETVQLTDVTLPTGRTVALDLERVRLGDAGPGLHLDGHPASGLDLDEGVTLWSGTVAGDLASDVYLAFSAHGSRGWIRGDDGLNHLLTDASPAVDARLVTDADLRAQGVVPQFTCETGTRPDLTVPLPQRDVLPVPRGDSAPPVLGLGGGGSGAPLPLRELRVAVETDTQFYDLFGDLDAARTYLTSLLGAVSLRYRDELGLVLSVPYAGLYSGEDPWETAETGGSSISMLFEFLGAWNGQQAPADADVYHFISGAGLGGGVAFTNGVCNGDFGFAVSGNMGGVTPFPFEQGPLNWDFVVVAHEIGHNLGTGHTHDFCPTPLDSCAPEEVFGGCQTEQVCDMGSIMSYCHLCPGGIENIDGTFHPVVRDTIRFFVDNFACLRPYDGALQLDLGNGLEGDGDPRLTITDDLPAGLTLALDGASGPSFGALIWSGEQALLPFLGGVLVPRPDLMRSVAVDADGSTRLVARTPPGQTYPDGMLSYAQMWVADAGAPQGWAATNAVQVEAIIADDPAPPQWIPHPTNGLEYAITTTVGPLLPLREEAREFGGELAVVDSAELNQWILDNFQGSGVFSVFIGLHDLRSEGDFQWFGGTPLGFTNWGENQPNDLDPSGQQAVEFLFFDGSDNGFIAAGQWNDWTEKGWLTNRALMQRAQ